MPDEAPPASYRFGPLNRRGLIAGWRGGQIAVIVVGLLLAVAAIRVAPNVSGAVGALFVLAAAALAATWPVAGRTGDEWAPDVVRHAVAALTDTRAWRLTPPASGGPRPARPTIVRGPFAGLRILPVAAGPRAAGPGGPGGPPRPGATGALAGPGTLGVIHDQRAGAYTAVLPVRGEGFVLLDAAGRDQRVSAWAGALAALAHEGSPVHRVQWVVRATPAGPDEVRAAVRPPNAAATGPAAASYEALLQAAAPGFRRHHCFVALSVHARRSARLVRSHGGGHLGACVVLRNELTSLRRRLAEAGLQVGAPLGPGEVAATVRAASARPPHPVIANGWRWPWPVATDVQWRALRSDDTWHVTYWIAEWPRTDVRADFLGPLLLAPDVRQTIAVTMAPVGSIQAARQVEQARTAGMADDELRRRGGFLATARRRRQEETLAEHEEELADGHASFRFTGYVTVSAEHADGLDESCARVEQAAAQAGIELRRCYGDQLQAFMATLPLGRGLD